MSDSASLVSQAQMARLAGVARAAVTQWRKRYVDFPAPFGGSDDRFLLADVIDWLDRRPIPANRLAPEEAPGATFGDRIRRRLRSAEPPDAELRLGPLRALGPEISGDTPTADYLYLLLCLAYLRLHDQDRWVRLTRHLPATGDPGQARQLLRRIVAAVDVSLDYPQLLSCPDGPDAPPARLRPRAYEPVRKAIELTAGLQSSDLGRLHAALVRAAHLRDGAICTPTSVTRTMVALLAGHTVAPGNITVYDPFARFGELLTEFVRDYADRAAVRVYAQHPHAAELRLAGICLAAAGTPAELAATSSPPPGGATFLLTNPPFGIHEEPAWLRHCVDSLATDGCAAVLMPYRAGLASTSQAHNLRRELVETGAVRAVVALPAQMFPGNSVGVCIWLLRPPTGRSAPVRLVDARTLGELAPATGVHTLDPADIATIAAEVATPARQPGLSVLATPDEIRLHDYSLHPPEYQDRTLARISAADARAQLDKLFAELDKPLYTTGPDHGWSPCRLSDLCEISTGVPHKSLKRAVSNGHTELQAVPVIHPRHLRNGLIVADDAPKADATVLERYRLHTGDVLWVRTGAMGQTAIVRDCESGWLPHTNLIRLRVKEPAELDPAYLLTYLSQPAVQARIRDRSVRSTTTSLNIATLGAFEIPLPPLSDQQRIHAALQALEEQEAAIEQHLAAVRDARTALGRHLTDGTIVLI